MDKPSYINQSESLESKSSILDNSNLIQTIEENFNETKINKLGRQNSRQKIRILSQPYYSRCTAPNLQLETNKSLIQSGNDGNTIYQWNMDGKLEYEIVNTLQHMGICARSCITNGVSVENATKLLAFGFTSQLKNWWDNILIE